MDQYLKNEAGPRYELRAFTVIPGETVGQFLQQFKGYSEEFLNQEIDWRAVASLLMTGHDSARLIIRGRKTGDMVDYNGEVVFQPTPKSL